MTLREYAAKARLTAIYPKENKYIYPWLGMIGEAGEAIGKISKYFRDPEFDYDGLQKEIGDCFWFISQVCYEHELLDAHEQDWIVIEQLIASTVAKPDRVYTKGDMVAAATLLVLGLQNLIKTFLGGDLWKGVYNFTQLIIGLCRNMNFSIVDILHANNKKLEDRANRGVLGGSGDNR